MNCHAVQQLLSTERDQALGADSRAALDAHVAGCAACRQMRAVLSESAAAWRTTTAGVSVPDARWEWQRIRRRLNGNPERAARPAPGIFTMWRSVTLAAAAAAVALGLFMKPATWFRAESGGGAPTIAATDSVEVGDASSAMVFVDDKSGWLVVWAADATEKAGS